MQNARIGTLIVALAGTSASAQVFSAVGAYSTNSAEFTAWQDACTATGAPAFGLEDFDSYNGLSSDPNISIAAGTTFVTPSGLQIFFDQSPDASSASRAEIDRNSASWTNDPPFEGTAAFEGFAIVPGGNGTGTNTTIFTFPEPVIGFAMDYESATSGGDLIVLIDDNVVYECETYLPAGADGWIGYIHTAPFTSIRFDANNTGFAGEVWDGDNVWWALAGDGACAPDLSPPPGGDGNVDTNDFFQFLAYYQAQDARADFSPGGGINTNDFFAFLAAYQAGC